MSRLFLVDNPGGGREVLKQIDPARSSSARDLRRFENEIDLARRLAAKGVGVVEVSLVGQVDGRLCYTMPYCAGGSLRDRLRNSARDRGSGRAGHRRVLASQRAGDLPQ